MPDIDPDQIPTLDDVIDQEETADDLHDATETDHSEPDDDASSALDDTPISQEHTAETTDRYGTGPEESTEEDYRPRLLTSLSFSYQQPYQQAAQRVTEDEPAASSDEQIEDTRTDYPRIDSETLDGIVEGAVKGLLPDLEQQLRFLIERSLREKLPDELIMENDDQEDTQDPDP